MILGAVYPGTYFPTGTASAPEEPAPAESPEARHGSGGGGGMLPYRDGPRFPGSRQRFENGQFVDDDAGLEEVGVPPRPVVPSPNAPTFEPPKPWTPETEQDDNEPAEYQGREGLGVSLPKLPDVPPQEPPLGKRIKVRKSQNDAAVIALLAAILEVWG